VNLRRIRVIDWQQIAAQGTFLVILITALGTLGDFAVQALLARAVSVAWYGDFSIAYATLMLGGILVILGSERTCMRFLPTYIAAGDRERVSGFLILFSGMAIALSLVMVAVFAAVHYALDTKGVSFFDTRKGHPVLFAVWLVPFYALYRLAPGLLNAADWPVLSTAIYRFAVPLVTASAILSLPLLGYEITPEAMLAAFALSFLVVVLITVAVKPHSVAIWCRHKVYMPKLWLGISIPIMAGQFLWKLNGYSGTILLEVLGGNEAQVGLFSAAQNAGGLVWIPYVALLAIILPKLGPIAQGDEHQESRQALYGRATRQLTVFTLLVAVPILLLREQVLGLFGADFKTADAVLILVVVAALLTGCLGVSSQFLQFCGHERLVVLITLGSMLLDVVLCLYLVPRFEAVGAATSFLIRGLVAEALAIILLWRLTGLVPFASPAFLARLRRSR